MNDEFRDYYDVLNVSFNASRDEIRRAFREAALFWHPDRNRGNEAGANEMMGLVNEAWEVLGNPEVRAEYDQAWMSWHNATDEERSHSEREEYSQAHGSREEYSQYSEWEEFSETPNFLRKLSGAIRWFSEMVRPTPVCVQIFIWILVIAFTAGILAGIVWVAIEIVKLVVELVNFIVELIRIIVGLVVVVALALGLFWVGLLMRGDER